MSLTTLTTKALTRLFSTPGGRRVLADLQQEADEHEQNLDRRHELVAAIESAHRRVRDDAPELAVQAAELEAAWKQAQAQADAARRRWSDVRGRQINLSLDANHKVDVARSLLLRSADPRLRAMAERLHDAQVNWPHTARRLRVLATVDEMAEAYTRCVNAAEVDALKVDVDAAADTVERLSLLAEPTEDEVVSALEAAEAALRPIEMTPRHQVVR